MKTGEYSVHRNKKAQLRVPTLFTKCSVLVILGFLGIQCIGWSLFIVSSSSYKYNDQKKKIDSEKLPPKPKESRTRNLHSRSLINSGRRRRKKERKAFGRGDRLRNRKFSSAATKHQEEVDQNARLMFESLPTVACTSTFTMGRPCFANSTCTSLYQSSVNRASSIAQYSSTLRIQPRGCVVSREFKFIYIHILKSAGMTVKEFLKEALCLGDMRRCHSEVLEMMSCSDALSEHPDFFVWSFVRNPYSRLYSGYAMAAQHLHGQRGKLVAPFTFDEFVSTPLNKLRQLSSVTVQHYVPQRDFLFFYRNAIDGTECPLYDFLGRLETFEEDLKRVVDYIGSPELSFYLEAKNIGHRNDTNFGQKRRTETLGGDLRNAYTNQSILGIVQDMYADDFRLFGYDKEAVPKE